MKQKYKGIKKHVNSMIYTDVDTRQITKDEEVEEEKKIDETIVIDETNNVSHSTVSVEDDYYRVCRQRYKKAFLKIKRNW